MNRYGVLLLLACAFVTAAGQCTFPTSLQGSWMTNSISNLTLTSNTLENYPLGIFGTHNFDCDQEYSGRYIVKSQNTITASGLTLHAYLCFDFTTVNSNLHYYYLASNFTVGIQAVLKVYTASPTPEEVCTRSTSQYDVTQFQIMIRDGDGEAANTTCPTDLVATTRYTVDQGSGNTCSTLGQLEGCTDNQLTANYTYCSTPIFYSTSGLVYCLASVTSGSLTYTIVFNSDTTVDNTNTFRLACLVHEVSGSTLLLSQYPDACQSNQTGTTVTTPTGSLLTFTNSTTCPTDPESRDITLYIVLGVIGGVLLLFIIGLTLFIFLTWKAKQRPFRGKLEPEGFDDKESRLQAFQNGFKRIKHPGELDRPHDREGSPDHEDDTPVNVMQLLRKDIITPGGRDSPSSNVLLSVTTPNPYSLHDGDSVGGSSLQIPAENPALRKHYHVIGGEPSVGGLEEEDEGSSSDEDGNTRKMRNGSGKRAKSAGRTGSADRHGSGHRHRTGSGRNTKTPVMVMPVRSDGSDMFDGDGDDFSDDALYEADGESTLQAARQGVGIDNPNLPPPRLPPIDEGPASHRSITGSGKKRTKRRRNSVAGQTPTVIDHNMPPIISEEDYQGMENTPRAPGDPVIPFARRHSENNFKMEGKLMVAMPDLVEQVDMGSGTVDEKDGEKWAVPDPEREERTRRSHNILSAGARRNSSSVQGSSAVSRPRTRKMRGKKYSNDEDLRPKSRVKMTRVDIPELLPPGEVGVQRPGENELVESPGLSYRNAAYQFDVDETQADNMNKESTPRKLWLKPNTNSQDVWNQVSHLWRKGQTWADKQSLRPDATSGV